MSCLVLLAACAASGPISGPVVAGAAAMVAVFDQLLIEGVLDPVQHQALVQGIGALNEAVEASRAGSVSPEGAAAISGTLTAAALAAIRAWRGPSSKASKGQAKQAT